MLREPFVSSRSATSMAAVGPFVRGVVSTSPISLGRQWVVCLLVCLVSLRFDGSGYLGFLFTSSPGLVFDRSS